MLALLTFLAIISIFTGVVVYLITTHVDAARRRKADMRRRINAAIADGHTDAPGRLAPPVSPTIA